MNQNLRNFFDEDGTRLSVLSHPGNFATISVGNSHNDIVEGILLLDRDTMVILARHLLAISGEYDV